LEDAVFAQVSAKSTKSFSKIGQDTYSKIAGRPIATVGDLTDALVQGVVKPSQIPLDFVVIDGQKVIANTRTSTALINSNISKNQWFGKDKTGVIAFENVTFDELVRMQLTKNYGGSVDKARR
jgi:filamentous hemagglutinin